MSHHDYGVDNETFCGGTPDDEPITEQWLQDVGKSV